jgi:PIN domain nuclease of toxin-antitoxin system
LRLLLDTHVWLWMVLEPERCRPNVRELILDAESEIFLSPVSVWEVVLLMERGRLGFDGSSERIPELLLDRMPHREAPLTRAVALATRAVTLEHRDPADRLLAATAAAFDLTLITADRHLVTGSGYRVLEA